MKRMIRLLLCAVFLAGSLFFPLAARAGGLPTKYDTSFDTVSRITGDLHHALERKYRPEIHPSPILLENFGVPYLQVHELEGTNKAKAVCISKGCVDLFLFISHAKAIDGVSRGFFVKSLSQLGSDDGTNSVPNLQADSIKNSWSFDTMNRQASYFNQMAGYLVAVEMAHVYLGHYQKYAAQLVDAKKQPIPLNRSITADEWHEAVTLATRHSLDCGLAVEGMKVALEGIDKIPARPAWRIHFLPDSVGSKEISKLNRELDQIQKNAFLSFDR